MSGLPFGAGGDGVERRNLPLAEIHASPMDVAEYDPNAPFWTPDWKQRARLLGWRWLIVLGILLLVGAFLWMILFHGRAFMLSMGGVIFKLGGLAVAGTISLLVWLRKSATQYRRDPFCIHCGYSMEGHNDGDRCPECGRPCSFAVSREYRRDPQWFVHRYKQRAVTPVASVGLDAGPNRRPSNDGTG
jgi:hypothetical protein